ncbi:MAG: peptidyl-dipeptidase Dcp [Steroidobacteraceae bacterium]
MTLRTALLLAGVLVGAPQLGRAAAPAFGPSNPFYRESTLPFHAPPFDRIRDQDYRPAIEAGMAQQLAEVRRIADNPAPPTFENTLVALERSGRLLDRAQSAFNGVVEANSDPALEATRTALAPELAAHGDAIHLNERLFRRIASVDQRRAALHLDPESLRLVEIVYDDFVHDGAKLSSPDKARLEALNREISTLESAFSTKLLAATREGAYHTTDRAALAGLSDAELAAAAQAARARKLDGYLIPLQNTTQQPALASLSNRATREAIFQNSWDRAERGDANDTRSIVARLAHLRAERAQLLGFPSYAAWALEDQMAKTPAAVLKFVDQLAPLATRKAKAEARDIQALIDAQHSGFKLAPWDWNFYAEQVRKAKYDLDPDAVKPYFEIHSVLENGVFYAAHQLYGLTFKRRTDLPVYQPDVWTYEVFDADGRPLALMYFDYFKRDNKSGGAWMDTFVHTSRLTGDLAVIYNVANLPKPAPGEPALISVDDVITMFHEFGHALHEMFGDTRYPTLSGTTPERDFVEFPSQFNEHWAMNPVVFAHYARHYRTGAPMPEALVKKLQQAQDFNQGYAMTELVAAAALDMQWHLLSADAPIQNVDAFEAQALKQAHLDLPAVPPRYRSSYFLHIWSNGYSAGYYAYLWTQMLADDGYQWFEEHGGPTRANGDRFRRMILSRGNTEDVGRLYEAWLGRPPEVAAMVKYRGLGD